MRAREKKYTSTGKRNNKSNSVPCGCHYKRYLQRFVLFANVQNNNNNDNTKHLQYHERRKKIIEFDIFGDFFQAKKEH